MLWPSGCQTSGVFLVCQSLHEIGEVLPGELPLEGLGGFLVAPLKGEESLLDLCEVHEVVGGQHLALDDGEVDLDRAPLHRLNDPFRRKERFGEMPLGHRLTWRRKAKGTTACRE